MRRYSWNREIASASGDGDAAQAKARRARERSSVVDAVAMEAGRFRVRFLVPMAMRGVVVAGSLAASGDGWGCRVMVK